MRKDESRKEGTEGKEGEGEMIRKQEKEQDEIPTGRWRVCRAAQRRGKRAGKRGRRESQTRPRLILSTMPDESVCRTR